MKVETYPGFRGHNTNDNDNFVSDKFHILHPDLGDSQLIDGMSGRLV